MEWDEIGYESQEKLLKWFNSTKPMAADKGGSPNCIRMVVSGIGIVSPAAIRWYMRK